MGVAPLQQAAIRQTISSLSLDNTQAGPGVHPA